MKFYKLINRKYARVSMIISIAISFGVFSCSDDEGTNVNPNGIEAESAWVAAFSQLAPGGGEIHYMSVFEEAPEEIDVSNAVELGTNARIISLNENIYSYNSESITITKWDVDRTSLELSVSGAMSFAGSGFSGSSTPIIISETQAYLVKLEEGLIAEWDPAVMEITEIINVDPNPLASLDENADASPWEGYVVNGKIFFPIWYAQRNKCCDYINPGGATVAVFDPTLKTVSYVQDARLIAGKDAFKTDNSGNMYVTPNVYNWLIPEFYGNNSYPLHSVLKFNEDGTFDSSFEIKLNEVLPVKVTREVTYISNDKLVLVYLDTEFQTPSYDNRFDIFDATTKQVSIDLNTLEVENFSAFNAYNSVNQHKTIDGSVYFWAFGEEDGVEFSYSLKENLFGDYSEVFKFRNGFPTNYEKLW